MKLIVGLGNPGARYSNTRHNVGRLVAEALANEGACTFRRSEKLQACWTKVSSGDAQVMLGYPLSFMNVSGEAVRRLADHAGAAPEEVLVVVDEVALPFGKFRLRPCGSDGGHNGLKSVEASLGSDRYARLRIGIGPPERLTLSGIPLEEFVLAPFDVAEQKHFPALLKKGIMACRLWAANPPAEAMNAVNAWPDLL